MPIRARSAACELASSPDWVDTPRHQTTIAKQPVAVRIAGVMMKKRPVYEVVPWKISGGVGRESAVEFNFMPAGRNMKWSAE